MSRQVSTPSIDKIVRWTTRIFAAGLVATLISPNYSKALEPELGELLEPDSVLSYQLGLNQVQNNPQISVKLAQDLAKYAINFAGTNDVVDEELYTDQNGYIKAFTLYFSSDYYCIFNKRSCIYDIIMHYRGNPNYEESVVLTWIIINRVGDSKLSTKSGDILLLKMSKIKMFLPFSMEKHYIGPSVYENLNKI